MDRGTIEDLVALFVERRESGDRVSAPEFAATHPEAGPELLEALREIEALDDLLAGPEPALPERIGLWRVLGALGRGASGLVLRAEHAERPGIPVALKLLAAAAGATPRARERFRREGEALARLDHPGIVKVHATGETGGGLYLVMDLVEGRPLSRILAAARAAGDAGSARPPAARLEVLAGGDPYRGAASLVARIARALAAAHATGLVHRDVKPSNVLVRPGGEPVLVDFGLAGDPDDAGLTRTGDVVGTPAYLAPEQARGARADARADVFGAGAILHELLTLRPPREGPGSVAILDQARHRPLPPARRSDPGLPPDLDTILRRATAFRLRSRYAAAADLAADLEAFAAGRAIRVRPFTAGERLAEAWNRRRGAGIAAALALVALAGVAAGVFAMRGDDPVDPESRRLALLERATLAHLDEDAAALAAAAAALEALAGAADPWAALVRGMSAGRLPEDSSDPGIRALLEGERLRRDGRPADAVARLKAAVELLPRNPLPVVLLGSAAREAKLLDVARAELTSASRMLPESVAVLRLLADVHVARGEAAEAVPLLERAVALDPTDARAWYARARAEYHAGRPEAGLASVREALRLFGEPGAEVLNAFGAFLDANGQPAEAQAVFREVLARAPGRTKTRFNLALSLDRVHEIAAAEKLYSQVLAEEPENVSALAALAWMCAAGCSDSACPRPHIRDPERSEALFVRALRADAGRTKGLVRSAPDMARRIGRAGAIREALEALLPGAEDSPAAGWIHAALRALDDPPR